MKGSSKTILLPQNPKDINVQFLFATPKNPNSLMPLCYNFDKRDFGKVGFKKDCSTKLVVHGFFSGSNAASWMPVSLN